MNASRFRKQVHKHSATAVDWTRKRRVSLTVLILLDSITTDQHRTIVSHVEDWATSLRCGIAAFDSTGKCLVLGSGCTHQRKEDTLSVVYHAKQCEKLLRNSGMKYRIRPVAPYHFLPEGDTPAVPEFDFELWESGDPAYRESIRQHRKIEDEKADKHMKRLASFGCRTD